MLALQCRSQLLLAHASAISFPPAGADVGFPCCLVLLLLLLVSSLQLDDIKQFRQWDSKTPGHPENFLTPGVEVTTGAASSLLCAVGRGCGTIQFANGVWGHVGCRTRALQCAQASIGLNLQGVHCSHGVHLGKWPS